MRSDLFIRRPVLTTLLMAAFIIAGIGAYRALPVSDLPNVGFPTIQVSASLPGASPETMASAVATPLERQFTTIAGIDSIYLHAALHHPTGRVPRTDQPTVRTRDALARGEVGEVDAGGAHANAYLPGAGVRVGRLADGEDFGRALLRDPDLLHRMLLAPGGGGVTAPRAQAGASSACRPNGARAPTASYPRRSRRSTD